MRRLVVVTALLAAVLGIAGAAMNGWKGALIGVGLTIGWFVVGWCFNGFEDVDPRHTAGDSTHVDGWGSGGFG